MKTSETKQIVIQSQNISFASSEAGYTGTWTSPVGKVVAATATYSRNKRLAFSNPNWFMRVTTPFGLISMDNDTGSLALSSGMQRKAQGWCFPFVPGETIPYRFNLEAAIWRYSFTVTLRLKFPPKNGYQTWSGTNPARSARAKVRSKRRNVLSRGAQNGGG
jgi:conjugal transfer mating pair stabilization protein TraN